MIQLNISDQELADIDEVLDDPATSEKAKKKLLVLKMHAQAAKSGFIAKVLNLHQNSISNYLKEYRDGGLSASLENRYHRPVIPN